MGVLEVPCPDIDPVEDDPVDCPDVEPAVDPGDPAVCSAAIKTPSRRKRALGAGFVGDGLLQVSATLVALLTLNCFVEPAAAELEFIPELAPADALLVVEA